VLNEYSEKNIQL